MAKEVYSKEYYSVRSTDTRVIKTSDIEHNVFDSIEEAQNYIDNLDDDKLKSVLEVDTKWTLKASEWK